MDVIRLDNVTKMYGRRTGVVDLSTGIEGGRITGFLGPNGSGKTTTMRLLLGLLRPTRGTATIFGRDCWRGSTWIKASVGYLPGDLRLYPWMTCRRALAIVQAARARPLTDAGLDLADQLGLELDLRVRNMSRGTRQKLGLVLALAHRPQLTILDEPTQGLDPLNRNRLYEHLKRMVGDGGTVFVSSHTLSEVETLSDRVIILRGGRIVADEEMSVLRDRARRLVTIHWKKHDDTGRTVPPVLTECRRVGTVWTARLRGSAVDLVRWCADQPIDDLDIGRPDLGAVFEQYYE